MIALSAWLNVAMSMHFRNVQRLAPRPVALLLAYDIAQLTVLMVLTGGIENPFAFLILAPVLIAAISLPLRYTLPLGAVRGRLLDVDRVLFLAAAMDQPASSWCCRRSTSWRSGSRTWWRSCSSAPMRGRSPRKAA